MGTNGSITTAAGRPPNRRLVLAIPIGLVAVVLIVRVLVRPPSGAAGGVPSRTAATQAPPASGPHGGLSRISVDWRIRNVRDPFHSDHVFPAPPESSKTPVDERLVQALKLEGLRKEANAQLSLHGTMVGPRPMAVINGGMHRRGDTVAGFRLTQIEAKHIVVERDVVELMVHVPK